MTLSARLTLSHGLSALATAAPWPALVALAWDRTHSDSLLALVGAARVAPYVLLSWYAGALGDRFRRDRVLRWTTWARLAALLAAAGALGLGQLIGAVVLSTLAVALGTPAYPTLAAAMPDLAPEDAPDATRWLVTAEVGAWVAGPAVGGLALAVAGADTALLVAAACSAVGCLLLLGTARGWGRLSVDGSAGYGDAVRTLLRNPAAVRSVGVVAVVNLLDGAVAVGLLRVVGTHWLGGERIFGLTVAAIGVGALLAPVVCLALRLPPTAQIRPLALMAAAFLSLVVAPDWRWALLPLALTGVLGTQLECAVTARLQQALPREATASALGITDTVMVAAGLVGVVSAPYVVSALGADWFLVLLAAVSAATVLLAPRTRPTPGLLPA